MEVSETKRIDIDVECFESSAPGDLVATAISASEITLTWIVLDDELETEVWRSLDNSVFALIVIVGEGVQSFEDTGLVGDTTYFYKVKAVGGALFSNTANDRTFSLSVEMDGINDTLIKASANQALPDNWSLEMWIKPENASDAIGVIRSVISSDDGDQNLVQVIIEKNAGGPFMRLFVLDSASDSVILENITTNLSNDFTVDQIYMIGISCSESGGTFTYNVFMGDQTNTILENTMVDVVGTNLGKSSELAELFVGNRNAGVRLWKGLLNKYRMYTDVLTEANWVTQFNNGNGNDVFNESFIFNLPLSGHTGGVIDDLGPNDLDLTMANFVSDDAAFVEFD